MLRDDRDNYTLRLCTRSFFPGDQWIRSYLDAGLAIDGTNLDLSQD